MGEEQEAVIPTSKENLCEQDYLNLAELVRSISSDYFLAKLELKDEFNSPTEPLYCVAARVRIHKEISSGDVGNIQERLRRILNLLDDALNIYPDNGSYGLVVDAFEEVKKLLPEVPRKKKLTIGVCDQSFNLGV